MEKYAHLRPEDLHAGLEYSAEDNDYRVGADHPVIDVITLNELYSQLPKSRVINERTGKIRYCLPKDLVDRCLLGLKRDVLGKLPHSDLREIIVDIERADGNPTNGPWWKGTEFEGPDETLQDEDNARVVGNTPVTFTLELGLLHAFSRRASPTDEA
jgi:hypothetical protein